MKEKQHKFSKSELQQYLNQLGRTNDLLQKAQKEDSVTLKIEKKDTYESKAKARSVRLQTAKPQMQEKLAEEPTLSEMGSFQLNCFKKYMQSHSNMLRMQLPLYNSKVRVAEAEEDTKQSLHFDYLNFMKPAEAQNL